MQSIISKKSAIAVAIVTISALTLAGCTDLPTMLAGTAKGFCAHNPGTSPCTRPGPAANSGLAGR